MKVLANAIDPFDFTDEETGRSIKGATLQALTDYSYPSEDKASGFPSLKIALPAELASGLRGKLPAILELQTTLKRGAGGKATLMVVSYQVLAPFNLLQILGAK